MFTSARKEKSADGIPMRTARIYLAVSAFCGVFSFVYEHYSHGVYSAQMICLFLFPLLAGALPFFLVGVTRAACPSRMVRYAWNAGVAALTVGDCLDGVFEIYGTSAPLVNVYYLAAAFMMAFGFVVYCIRRV